MKRVCLIKYNEVDECGNVYLNGLFVLIKKQECRCDDKCEMKEGEEWKI